MKNSNRLGVCLALLSVFGLSTPVVAADPLIPNAAALLQYIAPPVQATALRLGIFDVHPRLSVGVTYDDNITLSATAAQSDVIWTVSPGISAVIDNMAEGYGTSLTLGYDLSIVDFRHNANNSSQDHRANFAALWALPKLTLGVNQTFQRTSTAVVEVGDRRQVTQYSTQLTSHYELGEKTTIEFDPRLAIAETEGLIGSTEWGLDAFLNRLVTPKVTASLGMSAGYVDVDQSPAQIYERGLLRGMYTASGKLNFEATVGGEWRQYNSGRSDTFIPVFGIGGAYRPVEGTDFTLAAYRRETVSALLTGENYTAVGLTAGIRQRLPGRCYASLSGSYENRDYRASDPGITATRQDDFYLLKVGIGITIRRNWTADAYYQYEENSSNESVHRSTDNQFGLQATMAL